MKYVAGPELTRDELAATDIGRTLEAFLVGGFGDPAVHGESEAFSIVSDSLALGYRNGLPTSYFEFDGGRVVAAGRCRLVLVSGDRVAYPWQPTTPLDTSASTVPIRAIGGGCVIDGRTENATEIVSIDVTEGVDHVDIVVWVHDRTTGGGGACAGVGTLMEGEADLAAPLGDRTLIDAGTIPATVRGQ